MKKVNYAIGAVGLVSGFGLVMPATVAVAGTAVKVTKPHKKVSHIQNIPALTCGGNHTRSASANRFANITLYSNGGGGCINSVLGTLSINSTGLQMRTRVYNHGTRVFENFVHGSALGPRTTFKTRVNVHGNQTCAALVNSQNHAQVKYGPECLTL